MNIEDIEDEQDIETPEEEVQDQEQGGEDEGRDYESEARNMGWVDADEWKGNPDAHVSAKEFVERGEERPGLAIANNKKLQEQLNSMQGELAAQKADFQRMVQMNQKREERQRAQYEQELRDVKAAQAKAFENGDEAEFKRLDSYRDSLNEELRRPMESESKSDDKEDRAEVERQWIQENSWYTTDHNLYKAANEYSQFVSLKNPNMSMKDNLAQVDEFMRKEHPEAFGMAKPKPKPRMDNGSNFNSPPFSKKSKGFADLTSEAKRMCEMDIEDGLFENKEEWVKEYFSNA